MSPTNTNTPQNQNIIFPSSLSRRPKKTARPPEVTTLEVALSILKTTREENSCTYKGR